MQLFSLVLASIVLFSVIGLHESFAEYIPSPRQQLESGVSSEDIQCNDNRVLVIRTNGNYVCVTMQTTHKLVWVPTTSQYPSPQYSFPIVSPMCVGEYSCSEGGSVRWVKDYHMTISGLPTLNEDAIVSINMIGSYEAKSSPTIYLSSNLEFVDVPLDKISKQYGSLVYAENIFLKVDEIFTMSVKVKATGTGEGRISFGHNGAHTPNPFLLYITKDQTFLQEDYYKMYPKPEPAPTYGRSGTVSLGAPGVSMSIITTYPEIGKSMKISVIIDMNVKKDYLGRDVIVPQRYLDHDVIVTQNDKIILEKARKHNITNKQDVHITEILESNDGVRVTIVFDKSGKKYPFFIPEYSSYIQQQNQNQSLR